MKRPRKAGHITASIIIACLNMSPAQEANRTQEVEKTLEAYLTAMSARDLKGLQAILDKQFVGVKAGQQNAKTYLVDTSNSQALLPPAGNHDWDKDQMKISSVKAEVSATHPSVAIVSFTLTQPLTEQTRAAYEASLQNPPAEWGESEKQAAARIIKDKAVHNAMFAMVARRDSKWKILCMSLPGK